MIVILLFPGSVSAHALLPPGDGALKQMRTAIGQQGKSKVYRSSRIRPRIDFTVNTGRPLTGAP